MNKALQKAFNIEMDKAISSFHSGELDTSFYHLERAHILGQSYIIPHTQSHWWMLKIGLKKRSFKEVFGQFIRILASIIFSRIWVPLGNTGGTNVNPLKPMPLPEDLKKLLNLERL
ncbi:MAG: DUF3703 domain-containing protein [Parashewanella sp.]